MKMMFEKVAEKLLGEIQTGRLSIWEMARELDARHLASALVESGEITPEQFNNAKNILQRALAGECPPENFKEKTYNGT